MATAPRQESDTTELYPEGFISTERARAFQDLLRNRRKELGQSQMEVAAGAGVSQTLVSTLERGPHIGMRVYDLFKVLQYYRIRPDIVAASLGFIAPESMGLGTDERVERSRRILSDLAVFDEAMQDQLLDTFELLVQGARSRDKAS